MEFIYYPKCSTCTKALKVLQKKYNNIKLRDIKNNTPSKEELEMWHMKSNLPIKHFFNTSGQSYKALNLKNTFENYTNDQLYELLSNDGMLLKRPLLITENEILVGTKHTIYEDE